MTAGGPLRKGATSGHNFNTLETPSHPAPYEAGSPPHRKRLFVLLVLKLKAVVFLCLGDPGKAGPVMSKRDDHLFAPQPSRSQDLREGVAQECPNQG